LSSKEKRVDRLGFEPTTSALSTAYLKSGS
jgi:hypothetical protein